MPQRPIITLTTDFGLNDHFVGAIKGVILGIARDAEIVDICHTVQAFDILDGALALAHSYSYYPVGTVHLVIVDPGVGSARRPIVASSEEYNFVAPDNGVLSLMYAREERLSVRHITADHYFLQPVSKLVQEESSLYAGADSVKDWFEAQVNAWVDASAIRRQRNRSISELVSDLIHNTYTLIHWEHVARAFRPGY